MDTFNWGFWGQGIPWNPLFNKIPWPKNISDNCPFMILEISDFWLYLFSKWSLILHIGQ